MAEHKSPILRFSQKELTELFESGQATTISHTKKESVPINLAKKESEQWEKFLGNKLIRPIPEPPDELYDVLVRAGSENMLSFEPHYLPYIGFSKDNVLPGWKIKPGEFYWDLVQNHRLSPGSTILDRSWVLIDTTEKPNFSVSQQMFKDDALKYLLIELNKREKIYSYDYIPEGSRFGISFDNINRYVLPELQRKLISSNAMIRLPRVIEFNILGNIFHPEWGETTSYEMLNDALQNPNDCLISGGQFKGGLAERNGLYSVNTHEKSIGGTNIAFRPMIVFPVSGSSK